MNGRMEIEKKIVTQLTDTKTHGYEGGARDVGDDGAVGDGDSY